MLDRPSIVCRVLRPLVEPEAPIAARPGDLLVVWPGHPTHTLVVWSADGATMVRHRGVADGVLYGALLNLYLDARIRCLSEHSERALLRVA